MAGGAVTSHGEGHGRAINLAWITSWLGAGALELRIGVAVNEIFVRENRRVILRLSLLFDSPPDTLGALQPSDAATAAAAILADGEANHRALAWLAAVIIIWPRPSGAVPGGEPSASLGGGVSSHACIASYVSPRTWPRAQLIMYLMMSHASHYVCLSRGPGHVLNSLCISS